MIVDGTLLAEKNFREVLKPGERTLEEVIAFIGEIKEERKLIQKIEQFLIASIEGKRNEEFEMDAGIWHALRTQEAGRKTYDDAKIREDMGDEWAEAHQKVGDPFYKLVVTRNK